MVAMAVDFAKLIPHFEWQKVGSLGDGLARLRLNYDALLFEGGDELLGEEGCEDLMLALKDNDKVMALALGANSVDQAGAVHLSTLLQTNDSILYFHIFNNNLKETPAMEAFATALGVNKTLVALQICNNNITPQGAAVIANELEFNNRTLLQLDISNNVIQNEGAKAFAKALRTNDIITTIMLGTNEIYDEGVMALVDALKVNYSVAVCDVLGNPVAEATRNELDRLLMRNVNELNDAFKYANEFAKEAPLRKAKLCFIGKDGSGKTALIRSLMGKAFVADYIASAGVKVTQVQARLNGSVWYRTGREPSALFTTQFLARFANIKLDEKVADLEKQQDKGAIGFAALRKKGNRRGSVQQRRGSVTPGGKKAGMPGGIDDILAGTRRSSAVASSRNSRRSSVAQNVINAVLGEEGGKNRRKSVKDLFNKVAEPFRRKVNDLLDDKEFVFYDPSELTSGHVRGIYSEEELNSKFDVHVIGKARRERDNLGFNISELSGNRVYYTMHHAFLTEESAYILVFNMENLVYDQDEEIQKDTIRYLNYWLKVVKYHSPNASLLIVGTHADEVDKDKINKAEHYISRLVFPEMHRMNQKKQEALKVNQAIEAANEYAKLLEEEAQQANEGAKAENDDFVDKKLNLLINEADRRLFFPVDVTTGKGVDKVRATIDKASQKQTYFNQKIPLRWLKFLDALRSDSELLYCAPARVKALAFQTLENHETEMAAALKMFNELGYIIHITEIEQLNDTVITDTLRFHNKIFKLVFNEEIATFDYDKAANEAGLREDLEDTMKNGIVSQRLLDFLWDSGDEERKFMIKYAQLTLIMAQYKFGTVKGTRYLIPSLIPVKHGLVKDTVAATGDGLNLRCSFSFRGFLTLGVYERLVCLCIQYSGTQEGSKEPILAMGWSQHYFGDNYAFRLERQADDIVLHVIEAKQKPTKLVANFDKMFLRLKQFLGKGFLWECLVDDDKGNKIKFNEAKKQKLSKWFAN